jgi:hypothetical protein
MARRRWKRLLIGVIAVPLLVWGCDRVQMIHWVGGTDLEVEFSIADGAAGVPVPGARVEIHQDGGGFYEDQEERELLLVADEDGLARRECRRSMCFGTRSGLGFTDTFAVHLPNWRYRAAADGFETTEWVLSIPGTAEFRRFLSFVSRPARLAIDSFARADAGEFQSTGVRTRRHQTRYQGQAPQASLARAGAVREASLRRPRSSSVPPGRPVKAAGSSRQVGSPSSLAARWAGRRGRKFLSVVRVVPVPAGAQSKRRGQEP